MITRQFPITQTVDYTFDGYQQEDLIFFDIETTGFAADSSYLYLIGCAYYQDNSYHMIQWFSEDIREEANLINAFFEFVKPYKVILHYNGSGFDIPYLLRKCNLLGLDYSFQQLNSIDLYKKIYPYKKLFKLKSFKQKSIEAYLNVQREDVYDGGDLIQIYQSYLGKKHYETLRKSRDPNAPVSNPSEADMLLHQLLLHNEDDIKGLLSISPILNYVDLFEKPIRILQAGIDQGSLFIQFEISANLPVRISYGNDLIHLTAYKNNASLSVQVYEGELKYFYENYKDYYYLPAEDRAIHKSLAHFVDKEHRVKAKPSNCYTKKQGVFAPQYDLGISPYFKNEYQDKLSFIEIHTDFLLQEETLELYVAHLLAHIL